MISQPEPIVLTGDAASRFATSLFRPTREEIERREAVMEKIDREVTITEHEDGFSAEVSWLDLSFLDDEEMYPSYIEFGVTMPPSPKRGFLPFTGSMERIMSVFVGAKSPFGNADGSDVLSCAA
ncbi:MAG: hypothetical protein IJQ15_07490 [Synergistaceae bacterium]|nr:hypothetical protein [Synergistaceae bacterium]